MPTHGPLTRYAKLQVAHAPGMPGTFPPAADFEGNRYLAIPACITARAWRTCRDACRDRLPAVTGKTFPAFPAHAHPQFCVSGKRPIEAETHGRSFADDSFKWIFLNENVWISLKISLKFVPKGPINNIPALVLIMSWRRPGEKPLSEPMMDNLPTHICVTRPRCVNLFRGETGIL